MLKVCASCPNLGFVLVPSFVPVYEILKDVTLHRVASANKAVLWGLLTMY
jgi:hypothetical protein